jgi:hypothetical protein
MTLGYWAFVSMSRTDWLIFVKVIVSAFLLFYLLVWFLESGRANSWKKGHHRLWKKPKKWQLVTFCVLWGFIIIGFVVLLHTRQ